MTLQQLNYVITISEAGSLNKASELLYISQPSLTSAVHELEKELGITIFNRSGRGVTLTSDGVELIQNAREVLSQVDRLKEKYGLKGTLRKKFGISCQHYSFAVKSFVETVKQFDMSEYEFAIRETRTRDVIEDVSSGRSEIGILYINNFNRQALQKILRSQDLEFHELIDCDAYVYLWKGHPLSQRSFITFDDLKDYPCLAFEQGAESSFYFAEEILSTREYKQLIRANDRATMLNLMVGLNGYTLCSGIICEELNGSDFTAVPFKEQEETGTANMKIGYIVKKNLLLSRMAELYIEELKKYLSETHA